MPEWGCTLAEGQRERMGIVGRERRCESRPLPGPYLHASFVDLPGRCRFYGSGFKEGSGIQCQTIDPGAQAVRGSPAGEAPEEDDAHSHGRIIQVGGGHRVGRGQDKDHLHA